jgi:hypothetical protein
MNQNRKIQSLKSEGLSSELLSTLNETQISSLYNRLLESKKKEFEEQTQTGVTTKVTTEKITTITPTALNSQQGVNVNGVNLKNQGGQLVAKELGESDEISEKFESKAQQGLFWAKCNKCKTDDCKWCKMAKEFSKSTSKKQYKDMPEKKHPEKTVKYKKKETKEGYLENVGKKVTDTYAKKFASFTPGLAWGGMKENYDNIIERYTEPTMKKRELLRLIENQLRNKKSLNEDFYYEGDMNENQPAIKEPATKPKPTEKPKERERRKPSRETPYENPETRPQGEDEDFDLDMMDFEFMADPAIKEPATKPKTPTEKPKERERRKPSRETPYERPETRPQGEDEDFDFVMEQLYKKLKRG